MSKSTVVRIKSWIWETLEAKSKEHFGRSGAEQEYLAMILTTNTTKQAPRKEEKKIKINKEWNMVINNRDGYMAEHFNRKIVYTDEGWKFFNSSTKDKIEEMWKFASILQPNSRNDEFWTLLVRDTGDESDPTDEMDALVQEICTYRDAFLEARAEGGGVPVEQLIDVPVVLKPQPCMECEYGREHFCKSNQGKFIPARKREETT